MMRAHFHVNILLCHEGESWAAQCMEYDIAAQGTSIDEALERWETVFFAYVAEDLAAGREALRDMPQAPKEYFERMRDAKPLSGSRPIHTPENLSQRIPEGVSIPPAFTIAPQGSDLWVCQT